MLMRSVKVSPRADYPLAKVARQEQCEGVSFALTHNNGLHE